MFNSKKDKKEKKDNKLFNKSSSSPCCNVTTPNAVKDKKEPEKVVSQK